MNRIKQAWRYFTKTEKALWTASVLGILLAFVLFDRTNYFALVASLVGVTSLILNAKGNPVGQALMLVFSGLYGYISWTFRYYGEMITYLGMTAPMALLALFSWLKNPYNGNRTEVRVNRISKKETAFTFLLTAVVTIPFYFILRAFRTENLFPSTLSVATSFLAAYLTFRRSPYFAIAYAANDIVLVILWVLASLQNPAYLSVVVCFVTFLVNDIYGYIRWRKMQSRQTT